MYLLKRLMYREELVGATYLLGNIYVIAKGSFHVLVYTGHSPYDLTEKIFLDGINAVDIATSYADICVYVLDDGNGRVSRIGQDHSISTAIDGLERGSLVSMSVTMDGRIIIAKKDSEISTYGTDGSLISVVIAPLNYVSCAVEDAANTLVVCNETTVAKITHQGKPVWKDLFTITNDIRSVTMDRKGNLIACESSRHDVIELDPQSLQTTATLLTVNRDGIENPHHVQYVLENGLMLVSWMNFLDVYSFRQTDTRGYLASSEHDIREQQTLEARMLEGQIAHTNDDFIKLVEFYKRSGKGDILSDLPPEPQESELPAASSLGT